MHCENCQRHGTLIRIHRTLLDKLLRVKYKYSCKACGYINKY